MPQSEFAYDLQRLEDIVAQVLDLARQQGATAGEAEASESLGQSVTVRCGGVDTIEHSHDKALGITAYIGQQRGHASSSDFSPAALQAAVAAACSIARLTARDQCAGLPDVEQLASRAQSQLPLDLYHPWTLSVDAAIDLARRSEQAGYQVSRLITNSDGASVATHRSQFIKANSLGFMGGYRVSMHYLACSLIASHGGDMQVENWYTQKRQATKLAAPEAVGRYAAERALARLQARKLPTGKLPVLLEAPLAAGLIGSLVHAASGGALYRKSSFLLEALGQQIFPDFMRIEERPHLPQGLASCPFDEDGLPTRNRDVVRDGVLQGYFLSTYTARKLSLPSTANAGGCHNLLVHPSAGGLAAMLRGMERGLLVTELLGHGINYVNGDYSRGAAGYWVEQGEICFPVHEITIAGNLRDMFRNIVAVGDDVLARGAIQTGSILLGEMMVAG